MPQTTGNVISATGAAAAAGAAETASVTTATMLSLPWGVIAVASVVSGLVALISAANRNAAAGVKPQGWRWMAIEFCTGVVAGAAIWSLTEFFNPDPKLQLAAAIFAGWQARVFLDKYLPEFWRRITDADREGN